MSWLNRWPVIARLINRVAAWTGAEWTAIGTMVTAIIALAVVFVTLDQWRTSNALELQKLWTTPEMMERHARVVDAYLCKFAPARAYAEDQSPDQAFLDAVSPTPDYVGLEPDLGAYIEFFDGAETCIREGLCDKQATCELFAPDAEALGRLYSPTIERQRALLESPDWGKELQRLTTTCRWQSAPQTAVNAELRDSILAELTNEPDGVAVYQQQAACNRMIPAATSPDGSAVAQRN